MHPCVRRRVRAYPRLGRPTGPSAACALDNLIDALETCEHPASRRLPRRDRRKLNDRAHWKRI